MAYEYPNAQVAEMNYGGEARMLPYMLLLHAFCVVDPTLCAPSSDPSRFVVTLQPYLKSQVCFLSFSIFFS